MGVQPRSRRRPRCFDRGRFGSEISQLMVWFVVTGLALLVFAGGVALVAFT